jgi:hypothetical protein
VQARIDGRIGGLGHAGSNAFVPELRGYVAKRPVSAGDALARFLAPLRVRGQEIRLETGERAARTARATPRRHPDAAHR